MQPAFAAMHRVRKAMSSMLPDAGGPVRARLHHTPSACANAPAATAVELDEEGGAEPLLAQWARRWGCYMYRRPAEAERLRRRARAPAAHDTGR